MAEGHSLWASRGLLVLIMVWAFTSMIALAFQCPLPTPWMDTNRCVNQVCTPAPLRTLLKILTVPLGSSAYCYWSFKYCHGPGSHNPSMRGILEGPRQSETFQGHCPLLNENCVGGVIRIQDRVLISSSAMVVTIMQLTYVRRVYVDGDDKTCKLMINESI
jgi:hypothetical protein